MLFLTQLPQFKVAMYGYWVLCLYQIHISVMNFGKDNFCMGSGYHFGILRISTKSGVLKIRKPDNTLNSASYTHFFWQCVDWSISRYLGKFVHALLNKCSSQRALQIVKLQVISNDSRLFLTTSSDTCTHPMLLTSCSLSFTKTV